MFVTYNYLIIIHLYIGVGGAGEWKNDGRANKKNQDWGKNKVRGVKGARPPEVQMPPLTPTLNCSNFWGKNNSYSIICKFILLSEA